MELKPPCLTGWTVGPPFCLAKFPLYPLKKSHFSMVNSWRLLMMVGLTTLTINKDCQDYPILLMVCPHEND